MTKKKIERVSVMHREKILWLKWYFMQDKENPKYSVLERKMFDAAKNQDMLAYQKYATLIESLNHSYLPDWRGINQLIRYKNSTSLGAIFLPAELINLIPFLLPLKIIQLAHVCIISSKLIKNWS